MVCRSHDVWFVVDPLRVFFPFSREIKLTTRYFELFMTKSYGHLITFVLVEKDIYTCIVESMGIFRKLLFVIY